MNNRIAPANAGVLLLGADVEGKIFVGASALEGCGVLLVGSSGGVPAGGGPLDLQVASGGPDQSR